MAQLLSLPKVGTRLAHGGYLGTIRSVGPVDGTQGTWLGVEWDDPRRGKHDGEKDGRKYFSCIVKNAGSFIRPNASIVFGVSFLTALVGKYTDIPHSDAIEKVILGSSNGAIEVEAVRLNKIRANLSRLDTLREVSLDNEYVAWADKTGEIRRTCPGIRGLDLSKNLFPSWDIVASVVAELPLLRRIALNMNRLTMPQDSIRFVAAFSAIQELQLNSTLIRWPDLQLLISYMPSLTAVEYGYNRLLHFTSARNDSTAVAPANASLRSINLDSNELSDWAQCVKALQCYTNLERVIISSNLVQDISPLGERQPFVQLRHLSLTANKLKSWEDIDHLHPWCPALESLTLFGNPLVEDAQLGHHARQFVIAKIPTLKTLDAAAITAKERTDCELFYISYINKNGPKNEEMRCKQHPRWEALCSKYGKPDAPGSTAAPEQQDKLSNRLLDIKVHRCLQPPSTSTPDIAQTMPLRVLPTMSMRTFRLKISKSFALHKSEQPSMKLWLKMPDETVAYLEEAQDMQDLSWLGFENNSEILLYTPV